MSGQRNIIGETPRTFDKGALSDVVVPRHPRRFDRGELSQLFGKEVNRDVIWQLRGLQFIAAGPRSPQPGAPYTYVTTKQFLSHFGFDTLRDLPDMEQLEEAGLLSKQKLLAGALPGELGVSHDLHDGGGEGDLEPDEPALLLLAEDMQTR